MTQPKRTTPDLIAYHVADSKTGGKAFWTKIGAAWQNDDGRGYKLKLELLPLGVTTITLRDYEPRPDAAGDEEPSY